MVNMNLRGKKVPADHRWHCPRTDTVELKLQIEKKLGLTKFRQYFNLLHRYLSLKVSKSEFDKLCIRLLGRENLSLHNKLIRAILKNACVSKSPLRNHEKEKLPVNVKIQNRYQQQTSLELLCRDVLPKSPKKSRTLIVRDRRSKDRPNLLGPHGKPPQVVSCKDVTTPKVQEQQSATELFSLGSKPPVEVNSVEEGEEVDQLGLSPGIHSQSRSPLAAPIGVSVAAKGTRKLFCHGSSSSSSTSSAYLDVEMCYKNHELPGLSVLKNRLEQKLAIEGLKVSEDCANLLNNGLDMFMKRLLKPCVDLAASRSVLKNLPTESRYQGVSVSNGMRTSYIRNPSSPFSVSMIDFRVAMESDPWVLGEDWPVQFEKICFRASEE